MKKVGSLRTEDLNWMKKHLLHLLNFAWMVFALLLGKQCARLSERGCYYNVVASLLRFQILTKELEPSCCKKRQKKFPTKKLVWGIGDVWRFWMVPNCSQMINRVTHAQLGPIWYNSELSDVPYSPNQFLGLDFFCCFLQQTGSDRKSVV